MAYVGGLARRHPLVAARHLRGHRALVGLTGRSFAELLCPGRYADWLGLAAAWLEGRPGRVPQTWAALPPLPTGLIDADVLAMAGAALRDVADRAQHVGDIQRYGAVVRLRHTAGVHRLHRDAAAALGLRLELPFFDADVAEVCLSARLHERVDPYRAKPLLVEAVRGTVPDSLLMRTTMGVYDTELHLGWRRHRNDVRALLETTALAERGLVTDTGVARLVEGTLSTQDLFWLNDVLAAELWLRSLDRLTPLVRLTPVTLHTNDSGSH
jgi:asparagine synthase (glutamine-hydrolysing)